ncbi:hypothetical protein KKI93_17695 [Xenorhabdus bovienii]|uniref:NTP pyrophosphohydrolase n=1 Tax=Xenorhabdus bovienii str. puntauvense TaxID=1398201 RepID=A0A077N9F9_XENBV|nr:hypothetical protein [Xenorhabdus bovienii]MCG3461545.1 hypothetical protein [Xenorhabdus bovienii]MCG3464076.1 hypothetical protein [Xenorhabdus bovienii]MCP9270146.1 hypothetical protein [Xenorhabdus bovienii subsp. africana]MDE9565840.1 hypothetical protein [Xenorhabdus bovienii]CDG95689.1 conserved hypothetical protein [Xenorhabdus bovienii str. puntauvense]
MRPVRNGMCKFESLKNGVIDLADIALMNDALDVDAENEALIARWKDEQ